MPFTNYGKRCLNCGENGHCKDQCKRCQCRKCGGMGHTGAMCYAQSSEMVMGGEIVDPKVDMKLTKKKNATEYAEDEE